jgi:DNA mismatch repair protein MutS
MSHTLSHPLNCGTTGQFRSILFDEPEARTNIGGQDAPEFFSDLNLDQIVGAITAGRDEYNLKPFFHVPLSRVEAITYRHEVLRDLENQALLGYIRSFAQQMRTMRSHLAQADKLYYKRQKQSWFLEAVTIYCDAVQQLTDALLRTSVRSRGFRALREYLTSYAGSGNFRSLAGETQKLRGDLSSIRYYLHLQGKRITVSRYEPAPDYGADVLRTFEKFKEGAAKEYRFQFRSAKDMDHVEAAILDLVARLYPEIFSSLEEYYECHGGYLDATIARFDREAQFYLACLEHVEALKRAGLTFCYPSVSDRSKDVSGRDVFDMALANSLVRRKAPVVTNDFYLREPERILVVSGPNQGGKTTFARTFGQIHYLASIGCPVPGSEARLFLCDRLFTHFEKEENASSLRGKLEDELLRIHRILECATANSILIMNESFLSTTLSDALYLSEQVLRRIIGLDMLCVSVTFLGELASLSETTVSMVSTVDPQDPAVRTFKIVRRPADGLAYAVAIAEKYRLSYGSAKARIAENARRRITS